MTPRGIGPATTSNRSIAASCRAKGLILHVPVSKAEALELLPKGFSLMPIEGVPADEHLLRFDFAELSGGKGSLAGIDSHQVTRGLGSVVGAVWGAMFLNPKLGAKIGSAIAGAAAQAGSHAFRYEELIVTVPNVVAEGGKTPYQFVTGMRLNSLLGQKLEQLAGYGYHKEQADLHADTFTQYTVREGRNTVFAADVSNVDRWSDGNHPQFDLVNELGRQPFLGQLDNGEFALSQMSRTYDAMARAQVDLEANGVVKGLGETRFVSPARQALGASGAFVFNDADTRLTWPTRTPRSQL